MILNDEQFYTRVVDAALAGLPRFEYHRTVIKHKSVVIFTSVPKAVRTEIARVVLAERRTAPEKDVWRDAQPVLDLTLWGEWDNDGGIVSVYLNSYPEDHQVVVNYLLEVFKKHCVGGMIWKDPLNDEETQSDPE